jgi:hypothetical protein
MHHRDDSVMKTSPVRVVLRPEPHARLQVRVFIYPTLNAMRHAVRAFDYLSRLPKAVCRRGGPTARLGGCCYGVTERGRISRRIGPTFAVILLSATRLGIGTLSHEVFHATGRYLARKKIGPYRLDVERGQTDHKAEELAAGAHDEMMQQLVRALYARKILRATRSPDVARS